MARRKRKQLLLVAHVIRLRIRRRRRELNRRNVIRRTWSWHRPQLFFNDLLVGSLPEHMWREHFRVNRTTFQRICQIVGPDLSKRDTMLRQAIPLEKRVAVALHRLSTGNSYISTGLNLGLPKSTANMIKNEFCDILRRKAPKFVKFPETEEETEKVIDGFSDKGPFPQVAGAIDGSHIRIKAPIVNAKDYYCRKGFHSVILQGVVDSDGRFMHVSTGYPGSIHDSRMLRMSSLYRDIANERVLHSPTKRINGREIKPLLLGDPAYKLKTWLMKPYTQTGVLSASQMNYNKKLSSLRVNVEQAFGMLKGRWRCLQDTLNEDVSRIPTTIIACCVLHNICKEMGDNTPIEMENNPANACNNQAAVPGHDVNQDGKALREVIRIY